MTSRDLSNSEKDAVYRYSGDGYEEINAVLRFDQAGSKFTKGRITTLDEVIAKSTITENVVLFRGVGSDYGELLYDLGVGDTFVDHGFISTTTDVGVTTTFSGHQTLIRIRTPEGSNGFGVKFISSHSSEYEVILPRGSMFEIVEKSEMSSAELFGPFGNSDSDIIKIIDVLLRPSVEKRPLKATSPRKEEPRGDKFTWQAGDLVITRKNNG